MTTAAAESLSMMTPERAAQLKAWDPYVEPLTYGRGRIVIDQRVNGRKLPAYVEEHW